MEWHIRDIFKVVAAILLSAVSSCAAEPVTKPACKPYTTIVREVVYKNGQYITIEKTRTFLMICSG